MPSILYSQGPKREAGGCFEAPCTTPPPPPPPPQHHGWALKCKFCFKQILLLTFVDNDVLHTRTWWAQNLKSECAKKIYFANMRRKVCMAWMT